MTNNDFAGNLYIASKTKVDSQNNCKFTEYKNQLISFRQIASIYLLVNRFVWINQKIRIMSETTNDKEFVEFVVKAIVDNPDDVEIDRTVDEMGVLISLKINPADMGQVIGRQGSTAKSIRTLLRVIGAKSNARVNFKIIEPEGSQHQRAERSEGTERVEKSENVEDVVNDLKL